MTSLLRNHRCRCGHRRADHEMTDWMHDQSRVLSMVEMCKPCGRRCIDFERPPTRLTRLYWRCRAWRARLWVRLHGYPSRPPLDEILRLVPCPNHDEEDGPHHAVECHYYADERDYDPDPDWRTD